MGKIFDALEKFSKESGAPRSKKISNSDYAVLMQFDESTGKLDIDNPRDLKDEKGIKRLLTYRLINDDGTLTPAGRVKYEEMARKSKMDTDASADAASINQTPVFKQKEQKEKVSRGFINTRQSDWVLLMNYDRKTGNLLKFDPETGQLAEDSKIILQDPATVQRLIDNHMILPGGWLTPEAKRECARIEENNAKEQTAEKAKHIRRNKVRAGDSFDKVSEPPDPLSKVDMDVLLQHDVETRKLDLRHPVILKEPAIVKRLLENNMIKPDGKLTPQALVRCRVLSHWNQELKEKEDSPQTPKPSISEKLQMIAEKGESEKPSEDSREKKLKIIPLAKEKIEEKIDPQIETKKEDEKVPEKADNFITGLEARTSPTKPAELALERKFTLGKTLTRHEKNAIDKSLVSLLNPASFEAEQFKILRTNLLFPASGKSPRSILVTSVAPNEGKSFVAANLAVSVAMHVNWNVLLVDCDLRRPSVHRQFGFQPVPGLSDYLSNGRELHSLLLKTAVERLTILPGGRPPSNPSELLSSQKMTAFIDEVTARYNDRLIILDSPPPKLTSESTALARHVDGILLVVKYDKTPRDAAAELINKLGKEKILGAIVNNFDAGFSRYHKKYYGGDYYVNRK